MHRLVVADVDLADQARDVRGDADDISADAGVTGPGRALVVQPQPPADERGHQHRRQRDGDADRECGKTPHCHPASAESQTTAPSTMTNSARSNNAWCQTNP